MTRSPARSRGHVVFLWDRTVEVYVDLARGDLYRAPVTNVLDVRTGYRIGRWEAPSHMAEEALSYLLAAQDGNFSSGTWYRSKAAELIAAAKKCWLEENGWGEAGYMDDPKEQAEECAMLRERSVAGKSNDIPECPVHGLHPSEEVPA